MTNLNVENPKLEKKIKNQVEALLASSKNPIDETTNSSKTDINDSEFDIDDDDHDESVV